MRPWLPLLLLQSALLALVMTWPGPLALATQAVASPEGDGVKHLWNLWWMRAELLHGPWGMHTDRVNFPFGMDLYPIEPLNGLLSLLLPASPPLAANLLALLHLTLTGLFGGLFGGAVSGRRSGAHLAGLLIEGSSFAAFTLHVGVGELRQYWWIPLGLFLLVRLHQQVRAGQAAWGWAAGLGLALAGALLSCFYHGFFLAISVGIWAVASLLPPWGGALSRATWLRLFGRYAAAAALSLLLAVPTIRVFRASYGAETDAPRPTFTEHLRRPTRDNFQNAALDPVDLFRPRAYANTPEQRQIMAYTGGRYVGVGLLLLALLGLVAAPRAAWPWLAVAGVAGVLALGPVLWWDGHLVQRAGGGRVVLPMFYVNAVLSYYAEGMNFPARFLAPVYVVLAGVAALGARWRVAWLLGPLAVVEMNWGDLVPWPRERIALPDMTGLAAAAGQGAVLDLNVVSRSGTNGGGPNPDVLAGVDHQCRVWSMTAQWELDQPMQVMMVERVDHWATEGLAWSRLLPLGAAVARPEGAGSDYRSDYWLIKNAGFDRILMTHTPMDGRQSPRVDLLRRLLGEPLVRTPYATLWAVPDVTATPEEEAAWTAAQAQRLAGYKNPTLNVQAP